MNIASVWTSFALVAVSEMGDKTQLLAFALATRYKKPWVVMAGILAATLLNHGLASFGGNWLSAHIPPLVMKFFLAGTFIGFSLWILSPDKDDDSEKESGFGPFLTTAISFFLAEMGDKTQLATIALAARFQSIFLVTLGTTLGMLFSDGLAVFLGERIAQKISMTWIRRLAAGLFFIFGVGILFG